MPVYFNDAQKQTTRDARNIISLDILRIIKEKQPTPTALTYGLDK